MRELSMDVAGVTQRARSVCDNGEDLRTATRDWRASLASPDGSFELAEVTEAVTALRTAWAEDFAVYQEVLRQWCEAVQASEAGTVATDQQTADDFQRLV